MKVVRLLVLGMLSARGPMHGHQVRRAIELLNVEAWSEIRVGSLYHALHRLEAEELIEAVRTEQRGALPARTVYAITVEGETELAVLRDRGLREVVPPRDPFDIALWVAAGLPPAELGIIVRQRLEALRLQLDVLVQERRQLAAKKHLPAVGEVLMTHGEARLEAEIRWHEALLEALPRLANGSTLTSQT
jgi:DNA-binding PadR family transcriptional regulator